MTFQNVGEIAQVAIIERWQWYQKALKNPSKIGTPELPVHPNEYQLGYFRTRRKGGQWEPVGIYPDDNGLDVGMRNGKPVTDIQELFLWSCKNPITYDAYIRAIEGGGFEDEPAPAPTIGDNSGAADPLEAIQLELAGEAEMAAEFLKSECKTQEDADKASIWAKRLTDLAKRADDHRTVEKEPHLAACRAVDEKWREPIATAKDWAAKLKRHVEGFLIARKREEEERQRKAREEAEAAQRAAAEAARRAQETQSEQEREAAAREAERLADEAKRAAQEAEARRVNAGRTGARVALRTEKVAVVTDYAKAAAALVAMNHKDMIETIDKLAQRAAKAGMPFDGMTIKEVEKAV